MARAIAGIFALILIASVAVFGFQAALEDGGVDHTVTNETWTSDPGNVTLLDESDREGAYYGDVDTVTVYNKTSGAELEDGVDYEWYAGNGTVKALQGGALDPSTDALISYEFEQTTATQRQFAGLVGMIPQIVGIAFPALVFVVLLILVK